MNTHRVRSITEFNIVTFVQKYTVVWKVHLCIIHGQGVNQIMTRVTQRVSAQPLLRQMGLEGIEVPALFFIMLLVTCAVQEGVVFVCLLRAGMCSDLVDP